MNRRSVLTLATSTLIGLVAGCSAYGTSVKECHLMHELGEPSESYDEANEAYRYEDLSPEARMVVEETVENGHFETPDLSLDSEEFRYRDDTTVYNVTYDNETYTLLTYGGDGCERG